MSEHTNSKLEFRHGAIYTVGGVSIAKMDRGSEYTSPTERDANAKRFVQIWNLWPDVVETLEMVEANWGVSEGRAGAERMLQRISEEMT